jgi:hypothetical protein
MLQQLFRSPVVLKSALTASKSIHKKRCSERSFAIEKLLTENRSFFVLRFRPIQKAPRRTKFSVKLSKNFCTFFCLFRFYDLSSRRFKFISVGRHFFSFLSFFFCSASASFKFLTSLNKLFLTIIPSFHYAHLPLVVALTCLSYKTPSFIVLLKSTLGCSPRLALVHTFASQLSGRLFDLLLACSFPVLTCRICFFLVLDAGYMATACVYASNLLSHSSTCLNYFYIFWEYTIEKVCNFPMRKASHNRIKMSYKRR